MTAIDNLKAEIAFDEQRIAAKYQALADLENAAKQAVISELLEKIIANGIKPEDLFPTVRTAPKAAPASHARKKVAPKYRDPVTGTTWSGRGRSPTWMQGKDKAEFLIATGAPVSTTEFDAQDQVLGSHASPETADFVGSPSSRPKVGVVPSDETHGDASLEPVGTAPTLRAEARRLWRLRQQLPPGSLAERSA